MKRQNKIIIAIIVAVVISVIIYLVIPSEVDFVPKPRGFFRIDLPKKEYHLFDSAYPYTFEIPQYAQIIPDTEKRAEPYWLNVDFPKYKGRINISYKKVNKNLYQYFEDARTFANKHIAKATNIDPEPFNNPENKVYGLVYDIQGDGVASTYQFCVTDSSKHFIRGALYFNIIPNNDSLSPVIDFIKEDIKHLLKTLKWKEKIK